MFVEQHKNNSSVHFLQDYMFNNDGSRSPLQLPLNFLLRGKRVCLHRAASVQSALNFSISVLGERVLREAKQSNTKGRLV